MADAANLIRVLGIGLVIAGDEVARLILHRQPADVANRNEPHRFILRLGKRLMRDRLVVDEWSRRVEGSKSVPRVGYRFRRYINGRVTVEHACTVADLYAEGLDHARMLV